MNFSLQPRVSPVSKVNYERTKRPGFAVGYMPSPEEKEKTISISLSVEYAVWYALSLWPLHICNLCTRQIPAHKTLMRARMLTHGHRIISILNPIDISRTTRTARYYSTSSNHGSIVHPLSSRVPSRSSQGIYNVSHFVLVNVKILEFANDPGRSILRDINTFIPDKLEFFFNFHRIWFNLYHLLVIDNGWFIIYSYMRDIHRYLSRWKIWKFSQMNGDFFFFLKFIWSYWGVTQVRRVIYRFTWETW